jgi:hypothetical protein
MTQLRDRIAYTYEDVPGGGRVRITTRHVRALSAAHEFLRYQIRDHRTGDSLQATRGEADTHGDRVADAQHARTARRCQPGHVAALREKRCSAGTAANRERLSPLSAKTRSGACRSFNPRWPSGVQARRVGQCDGPSATLARRLVAKCTPW